MMLSVVIPLGPAEQQIGELAVDLLLLPEDCEIIFVGCDVNWPISDQAKIDKLLANYSVKWIKADVGRARQMNAGARMADGASIWFLHLDSHFDPKLVGTLYANLRRRPNDFHYFSLGFLDDGPKLMGINQWGANLRSRLLGVPFGDQGFCLSKQNFEKIGAYDEKVHYGEDHLLVWKARQQGIKLNYINQTLWTSARKYRVKGWGYLTVKYQCLWIKQAWPEWLTLIRSHF